MNATPETSAWLLPLAALAIVLLAVGAYLARTGLIWRRRGDVPHCAKCEYIIGGLEQPRCPECGADLTGSGAVVIGDRQRRRSRATAGLMLAAGGLVLGVLLLTPAVRKIDWYEYRPDAWVINDLKSADAARFGRASRELRRRIQAGALSDAERSAVVDVALDHYPVDPMTMFYPLAELVLKDRARLSAAQKERLFTGLLAGLQPKPQNGALLAASVQAELGAAAAREALEAMVAGGELDAAQHTRLTDLALADQAAQKPLSEGDWLLNYLGDRELADQLTAEERERFFRQAYAVGELEVRKLCIVGYPVIYRFTLEGRGPENGSGLSTSKVWWVSHRIERVMIDGKPPPASGGGTGGSGTGFSQRTSTSSVNNVGPGKHRIELVLTLAVYFAPQDGDLSNVKPRWRQDVTIGADFEVLKEAPPGYLKWVDDSSIAAAIKAAIKPQRVHRRSARDQGIEVMLGFDNMPTNVAFEVLGRVGGKEYPIGTVALPSGSSMSYGFGESEFPPFEGDQIDLILRSSEKALRQTVDMYEAWRGEVVFEGVRVEADPR